jgi:hypothetical protein
VVPLNPGVVVVVLLVLQLLHLVVNPVLLLTPE